MVKDCEVSLTLGRTGGFHLLASGKSIKKITSGWEWRQVTGRKLQEKMKGEMVQLQQHCLSNTSDAPWPNSCYYLSNSFTQLHKGQPDLWWGCAPAALRKQRGKSLERQEEGNWGVWSPTGPGRAQNPRGRCSAPMATLSLCTQ